MWQTKSRIRMNGHQELMRWKCDSDTADDSEGRGSQVGKTAVSG